jgi:hypothetical protein
MMTSAASSRETPVAHRAGVRTAPAIQVRWSLLLIFAASFALWASALKLASLIF